MMRFVKLSILAAATDGTGEVNFFSSSSVVLPYCPNNWDIGRV